MRASSVLRGVVGDSFVDLCRGSPEVRTACGAGPLVICAVVAGGAEAEASGLQHLRVEHRRDGDVEGPNEVAPRADSNDGPLRVAGAPYGR